MSRSIRSSRSQRITQTFDRPSRTPIVLFAAATLALAALIACDVKGGKQSHDSVAVTKPDDSQPTVQSSDSTTPTNTMPQNVSFALAESTYNQKRYKEASEMFGVYLQRKPENPWGHYMHGLSAWKSGQLDVAKSA